MNKIKLKGLKIEKFMSLTDTEVSFPESGVIQISGRVGNDVLASNGAGKSAMLESIFWVLYGKTLRGSNTDKSWKVTLEGYVGQKGFTVTRSKDSIDLQIEGLSHNATLKTDVQSIINRELLSGTSWKTFSTLVYFTPFTITKWFLQMSDTDRKNILMEVLNLSWLDDIYEKVKMEHYNVSSHIALKNSEMARKKGELDGISKSRTLRARDEILRVMPQIKALSEMYPEFSRIPELAQLHVVNGEGLESVMNKIAEDIQEFSSIQVSLNSTLMSLREKMTQLTTKKNALLNELRLFQNYDNCPTCHRPITKEFKQQKIAEIKEEIDKIQNELTEVIKQHEENHADFEAVNNFLTQLSLVDGALRRIVEMSKGEGTGKDYVEQLKQEIANIERELDEMETKKKELEKWKDIFSNTGVKAIVIEQIFNQIVSMTASIAELVGISKFKQSMSKGRIKYDNYKDLSSGEKRRAEIALLFALRSVIPTPTSFLVIDEIFDHLDAKGIQSVIPLLDIVSEDEQIFVVSHRPDLGLSSVTQNILVVKDPETNESKITVIE